MLRTLTVIYGSTTGHTEFVIDTLAACLQETPDLRVVKQRAEASTPEDLLKGDLLLLACGSWNTGGPEGQMNPWMHELLTVRAAAADLKGRQAAVIGLGDDRYRFTARAADLMAGWLQAHGATLILPPLKIVNDPYDQTAKVKAWASEFLSKAGIQPARTPKKK